jgi:hypothetical protein
LWCSNVNDPTNNSCLLNTGQVAFTNSTLGSGFATWDANQALYSGASPRLIQKRNDALGQSADVVLATLGAVSPGSWQQLTGTSSVATDTGCFEFVVDCDGTGVNANGTYGYINVDGWSTL